MNIITTRTDLATWLGNTCGDLVEAGLIEQVEEALCAADHPPWGTDWAAWLGPSLEHVVHEIVLDRSRAYSNARNLLLDHGVGTDDVQQCDSPPERVDGGTWVAVRVFVPDHYTEVSL